MYKVKLNFENSNLKAAFEEQTRVISTFSIVLECPVRLRYKYLLPTYLKK